VWACWSILESQGSPMKSFSWTTVHNKTNKQYLASIPNNTQKKIVFMFVFCALLVVKQLTIYLYIQY